MPGIPGSTSLRKAWEIMRDQQIDTCLLYTSVNANLCGGQGGQIAFSAEILRKTVVGCTDGEHHFTLVLCLGILCRFLCPD